MRDLKEVLEQNKEKYIEELKNLVGIDTHDLGHGIDGGLEKQGQEYMVNLFESMGADEITVDPMDEAVIQAVLRRIGMQGRITLEGAKKLIEKIQKASGRKPGAQPDRPCQCLCDI